MGWETRKGQPYLYCKVRRGLCVVSEYVGSDGIAHLCHQSDVRQRELKQLRRDLERADIKEMQQEDQAIAELLQAVENVMSDALCAAGFHQHKGTWRKMKKQTTQPSAMQEEQALLRRVNTLDPSPEDVAALKRLMKDRPDVGYRAGDAMRNARETFLFRFNATVLLKEGLKVRAAEMQKALAQEGDGVLEALLIETVVLCWMRLSTLECQYSNIMAQEYSLAFGAYWENRLSAAHKRYQKACVSLAQVRKLMRGSTTLQLNVAANGGQQVNIAK